MRHMSNIIFFLWYFSLLFDIFFHWLMTTKLIDEYEKGKEKRKGRCLFVCFELIMYIFVVIVLWLFFYFSCMQLICFFLLLPLAVDLNNFILFFFSVFATDNEWMGKHAAKQKQQARCKMSESIALQQRPFFLLFFIARIVWVSPVLLFSVFLSFYFIYMWQMNSNWLK